MRHDELREGQRREEIQLEQAARIGEGRAPGGIVEAHARIVHEDVDGAESIQRGGHGGLADFGHGEIARCDQRVGSARGPQRLRGARHQRKPRAAFSEGYRASRADTLGSSGDQDHFSIYAHR